MSIFTVIIMATVVLHCCVATESNVQSSIESNQQTGAKQALSLTRYNFPSQNRRCPLCDSSVYPYCGEKLLHDACCCTDPYVHQLPYQCKLADCRFLHSNSCREHKLIATCCCSDDYRSLLKSLPSV